MIIKMKIKKIGLIIIFCIIILLNNSVYAVNIPEDNSVGCSCSGTYLGLNYDEKELAIHISNCRYLSVKYPIYPINLEKDNYLSPGYAFYSHVNIIVENDKIRNALLAGYPNKTIQALGCKDEKEAYIITQIAVLATYYNYDLDKFSINSNNKYPNIITNLKNIINESRNKQDKKIRPELTIDEIDNSWNKETDNKYSKTYKIISNLEFETFEVTVDKKDKVKIINQNDEETKIFNSNEIFKIIIEENENIEFKLEVKAKFKTNPVKQVEPYTNEWQEYVLLGEEETAYTTLNQEFYKNSDNEELDSEEKEEVQDGQTKTIIIETEKKLPLTGM